MFRSGGVAPINNIKSFGMSKRLSQLKIQKTYRPRLSKKSLLIDYFYKKQDMKYFYSFLLLLALVTACRPKPLSGKALENKLNETMVDYLHKTLKPGSEVTIKDLVYYPEKTKNLYICTFTVEIRTATSDTTGTMMALIPNDFSKVTRTQ
jgi:hypothetical protein